jgi:hypothetical protein
LSFQLQTRRTTYGNSWWATILKGQDKNWTISSNEGKKEWKEKEDAELEEPRRFEGSMGE